MTAAAAAPPRARWHLLLLAALAVVLALLLPAVPASAATAPAAETRVGAFILAGPDVVGVHECITAGQRPVRGPSQPQIASGNCVAAEAGGARFAVNSAGEATMHLRAGSGSLEVTEHAARRLTQRGISIDAAETTLGQQPFRYFHNGTYKNGYYDPSSKVFLGSVDGRVTTVIGNAKPGYIENLKAAGP